MRFGRKKGRDAGVGQQASQRAKRFRWTVSRKIMALGLAGLCAALAVMLVQRVAIRSLAAASDRTAATAIAVRAGMQADMMQDAIRGDVYLGMLAGGPEPRLDATTIERDGQTLLGSLAAAQAQLQDDPDIVARFRIVVPVAKTYVDDAKQLALLTGTDRSSALAQRDTFEQSSQDLRSMLSDLTDVIQARAAQAASDANAVAERVQGMQIWFTIAVFAGFFYAARLVSRGITKPLAECVVGLESLAQADLTSEVRVTGSDEVAQLGASFNRAVGDLSDRRPADPRVRVDARLLLGGAVRHEHADGRLRRGDLGAGERGVGGRGAGLGQREHRGGLRRGDVGIDPRDRRRRHRGR